MLAVSRSRWAQWAVGVERAAENRIAAFLRGRPDWHVTVDPYVAHGTAEQCSVRGRVLVARREPAERDGPFAALLTAAGRYLSVEVSGMPVTIEVAGRSQQVVSGAEGYLDATVDLPGLAAGWHTVSYRPAGGEVVEGPLLVVDPEARLGIVSDLDDTVIHTGLTRALVALRNTLLVADSNRRAVAGGAELYRGLVAVDGGRSPVWYVSTGAWNVHRMLVDFLARAGFPPGPVLLTDWGPGQRWLFREDSAAFKARTILDLFARHRQLSFVLVGDSGQHDAEAYAAVVRAEAGRVRAVYIRDVPPATPARTARVTGLADEVRALGVPMLLARDSVAAAEHAHSLGLVDAATVEGVRVATE
ncbi:App1 family protein [soil metagenome]